MGRPLEEYATFHGYVDPRVEQLQNEICTKIAEIFSPQTNVEVGTSGKVVSKEELACLKESPEDITKVIIKIEVE